MTQGVDTGFRRYGEGAIPLPDTFVRLRRTQYDIVMSDCFEYFVTSQ